MRVVKPGVGRALTLFAVLLAIGCQSEGEEVAETPKLKRSVTEGKVDPQLVGFWVAKDPNGEFKMDLKDAGAYTIASKVKTQGGVMDSKVEGKWAVKADEILMERNAPDGVPFTVVYRWKLEGKSLELKSDGSKVKYRYERR